MADDTFLIHDRHHIPPEIDGPPTFGRQRLFDRRAAQRVGHGVLWRRLAVLVAALWLSARRELRHPPPPIREVTFETWARQQFLANHPGEFDPRKYLGAARKELVALIKHKNETVLGSAGKG